MSPVGTSPTAPSTDEVSDAVTPSGLFEGAGIVERHPVDDTVTTARSSNELQDRF